MPANTPHKLLLDENLSQKLVAVVENRFAGSGHVAIVNLLTDSDKAVWGFAKAGGFCILTKDWDCKFLSIRFGCPPKVIRLNFGNRTTTFIADLLMEKMNVVIEFLDEADACYLEIG